MHSKIESKEKPTCTCNCCYIKLTISLHVFTIIFWSFDLLHICKFVLFQLLRDYREEEAYRSLFTLDRNGANLSSTSVMVSGNKSLTLKANSIYALIDSTDVITPQHNSNQHIIVPTEKILCILQF